ncbi:MAG: hypothetical protein JSR21_17875, partial [Proteobacteria bacterium]|nr:hypothetical protein [Pseudomonadota bacterium]
MFDLDGFVAELRETLGERSRQAMQEVVARAVSDPASLLRVLGEPERASVTVLHRSPELTVLNAIWSPGHITPPHNHMAAAVIGMYGGREDNLFWRRIEHPDGFEIEAAGGRALGTGDVAVLGRDVIHSVINPLQRLSGAIHVYAGDFFN